MSEMAKEPAADVSGGAPGRNLQILGPARRLPLVLAGFVGPLVLAAAVGGVLVLTAGTSPISAQDVPPPEEPGRVAEQPAQREPPPKQLAERLKPLGSANTKRQKAITAGLDWLSRHQADDGRWETAEFNAGGCASACKGEGAGSVDVGITSLALLAYLGTGTTHESGAEADRVKRGIDYLLAVQDSEGCLGPRTEHRFMYCAAAATMALAEAWWLTGDPELRHPVERAHGFLLQAGNPHLAWRYGVRDGDNDTSVTGWVVQALATCRLAGLDLPEERATGTIAWIDRLTDPATRRTGYQRRGGPDARLGGVVADSWNHEPFVTQQGDESSSNDVLREQSRRFGDGSYRSHLTTLATLVRLSLGVPRNEAKPYIDESFGRPFQDYSEDGTTSLHLALHGALLRWQLPRHDRAANAWWKSMEDHLIAAQVPLRRGEPNHDAGSWDPARDPFGDYGGRVYSTAMAILALQAPTRFPQFEERKSR